MAPQLIGYLAIAIAVVCGARVFRLTRIGMRNVLPKLRIPDLLAPALGMLATGGLAILSWKLFASFSDPANPESNIDSTVALSTLGSGYGLLQQALDNAIATDLTTLALILVIMAACKMLATVFTVDTGNSGGIFGPSLVIGGCLGGAVGAVLNSWDLTIAPPIAACVLMGMAGFLSASFRTPIAALLMVSELTGNYHLLLPAMWVCALCFMLNGRNKTLLTTQVPTPLIALLIKGISSPTFSPASLLKKLLTIPTPKPMRS